MLVDPKELALLRLATIVDSADDAIIGKDLDGTTSCNRQVRDGKGVDHYEIVRVGKDGTRISVSLTVSLLVEPNGEIVGASQIARDHFPSMGRPLTCEEYRLLVRHSPVMVWRSGLDAKCDYFNPTWLEFTGRTIDDEMGDGWTQGVHADDVERCVAHYLDHFRRREPFEMEYRLRRHDGIYRWIFDRGVPFVDDNGNFAGFIGSCVDVDERRRARDAEQQRSQQQLALARDFEKWILAIVSHDIRDPLGTILFASRRLQDIAGVGSAAKWHADMVERGVHRIQHIVGDLLDFAREREGEGIPIEPRPADLLNLCRQIVDELEAKARERRITLKCDVDGAGEWDEHRIVQALSNLVSNALQHGAPGSPIHIRLVGNAEQVVVQVHNRGAIPKEVLPRIFEPFRSARQYESRGGGLGLGLFIARAIARAHGGSLDVDTTDDATMFQLVLPRYTFVAAAKA